MNARCVDIKCPLKGFDSKASILLRSRLWNSTFLEVSPLAVSESLEFFPVVCLITVFYFGTGILQNELPGHSC